MKRFASRDTDSKLRDTRNRDKKKSAKIGLDRPDTLTWTPIPEPAARPECPPLTGSFALNLLLTIILK